LILAPKSTQRPYQSNYEISADKDADNILYANEDWEGEEELDVLFAKLGRRKDRSRLGKKGWREAEKKIRGMYTGGSRQTRVRKENKAADLHR